MTCFVRTRRRIYQAKVDYLDARPRESCSYLRHIAFQPGIEARKLTPVSIEPDAAESYPKLLFTGHGDSLSRRTTE
jgi:hypothetical protein